MKKSRLSIILGASSVVAGVAWGVIGGYQADLNGGTSGYPGAFSIGLAVLGVLLILGGLIALPANRRTIYMKQKKTLILIVAAVIIAVSGLIIYRVNIKQTDCSQTDMAGNCLPEGKCAAPNDAIVDCEKLKQNPGKTDWWGNE